MTTRLFSTPRRLLRAVMGLLLLAALGFALLALPSQTPVVHAHGHIQYAVPVDWSLIPAGVKPGDSFRLLFVTSNVRNPDSQDISSYNEFVEAVADRNPNLEPYQFRVVGSTANTDARDNTKTTGTGFPIYWVGGDKVADNYSDFYDGTWDSYAAKNEQGNAIVPSVIATGSKNDGTRTQQYLGEKEWITYGSLSDGHVLQDTTNALAPNISRWRPAHYYALSPVFTVAYLVPADSPLVPSGKGVGDSFRLLFVTSDLRNSEPTDISYYNEFVERAANRNANLEPYEFRVVGSTEDVDARDNTKTAPANGSSYASGEGVPIYWVGGDKVADDYADFYDGTWDSYNPKTESGDVWNWPHGIIATGSQNSGVRSHNYLGRSSTSEWSAYGAVVEGQVLLVGAVKVAWHSHMPFYALSPMFTVQGSYPVSPRWDLVPQGLQAGDSFRLMFFTSDSEVPSSRDISTYNTFVQTAANRNASLASFKGKFRVVGSTSTVDARDNTDMTGTGMPIYWLGGDKLADNYSDFYDGTWDSYNAKDENGNSSTLIRYDWGILVYTGSHNNGTKKVYKSTVRDEDLTLGATDVNLGELRDGEVLDSGRHLSSVWRGQYYGISPVFTVSMHVPTPTVTPLPPPTATPTPIPTPTPTPMCGWRFGTTSRPADYREGVGWCT